MLLVKQYLRWAAISPNGPERHLGDFGAVQFLRHKLAAQPHSSDAQSLL